jgi:hypothetical protein
MRRRAMLVIATLLGGACTRGEPRESAPLLVQVQQAATSPSFTHVVLKVFRDEGGRPTTSLRSTPCTAVASLPSGQAGRHRLALSMDPGGPYFLQFTAYNNPACPDDGVVAAGLAPGVMAASGKDSVVPLFVAPVDAFAAVVPGAVAGAEVVPRAFHSAVVADDGSLIVAGGAQEAVALGSGACARGLTRCLRLSRATSGIHRFDPGSGAMVLVGALQDRRFLHSGTALGNGRIAFTGGAQSATLGGAAPDTDAPLVRADPSCTNPNDAAGTGCILRTVEVHTIGRTPAVTSLQAARAAHAALRLATGKLLVAGGRQSTVQLGCASDAQCAAGASCDGSGRCLKDSRDCTQVATPSDVCLPGFTCTQVGPDVGKCLKQGCASAEDCGGCLASASCTGAASSCDTNTGTCTKRGCSGDSECLGSNRRCIAGACVQVGCDALSGCPQGRTCDVRSGKCQPAGGGDCSQAGVCDCRADGDCASGFTCQTSGDLAGRCRATRTGCPGTVCRRNVNDPAQGPYFDPVTGALRRDVNCQSGQCVLTGCLGDVDCPAGFLCNGSRCVNGRRITATTNSVEVCDLSAPMPAAAACQPVATLATPREGLSAACAARDGRGGCSTALLWGGNADAAHLAELRGGDGSSAGEVALPSCGAPGACALSYAALAEGAAGVFAVGGAALNGGASLYRFVAAGYLIPTASPSTTQLFSAQLSSPRAFSTAVLLSDGLALLGGTGDDFAGFSAGGLFSPAGDAYSEPPSLRLATARFGHTATLLPDGRIVVIGGIDGSGPNVLSSVEIYTPRSVLR